jgi:hypothetical protein
LGGLVLTLEISPVRSQSMRPVWGVKEFIKK